MGETMVNHEHVIGFVAAGAALTAFSADTANADPADFAGPYAGLGFGTMAGTVGDDYRYAVGDQLIGSAYAGYNWLYGDTIIGAEIGFTGSDTYNGYDVYGIEHLVDVRGRVGMSLSDNTMLFGSVGLWTADYLFYGNDDGGRATGYSVGLGFETNMSNGMFIGGDVTMRSTSDVDLNDPGDDNKSPDHLTTATLRVGFRF